jgi:hypothetical protein
MTAGSGAGPGGGETDDPLIGSTWRIRYDNGLTFVVSYPAADTVHWQAEHGSRSAASEHASILALRRSQWMVCWLSDNGVTVTQVVDLERGTVTTFMTIEVDGVRRSELMYGRMEPPR